MDFIKLSNCVVCVATVTVITFESAPVICGKCTHVLHQQPHMHSESVSVSSVLGV